jgi:ATP adenylyltransferase
MNLSEISLKCQARAIAAGALIPLQTEILNCENWKPFIIRRLLGKTPKHLRESGPKQNPFLPWDPNLELFQLENHTLLLNKYPVEPGHLLLISKDWQPQEGWLTFNDWQALIDVWKRQDGLWFFNSGPQAGASQPHRHLQLLPRADGEQICPEEFSFKKVLNNHYPVRPWKIGIRQMPVDTLPTAELLFKSYLAIAAELGIGNHEQNDMPLMAYNLLISREWFVTIPRRCEGLQGFSLNALGYAGYLLATSDSNLEWLRTNGAASLLSEAAFN